MADEEIGGGLLGSAGKFGSDVWSGLSGLLGGGAAPTAGQQQDMMAMLSPEDQRRLGLSMLGQLGSTLLAAGQRQTGAQRAEKLGQLGSVGSNMQTQAYNIVQGNLMRQQMAEKQQMLESQKQLSELAKDPEAYKARFGYDPSGIAGSQLMGINQQIVAQRAANPYGQESNLLKIQEMRRNESEAERTRLAVEQFAKSVKDNPDVPKSIKDVVEANPSLAMQSLLQKPQGGLEERDRAMIITAQRNPALASTPEYVQAYNNLYGPKMVQGFNPETKQMEYQWVSPPLPQGVLEPKPINVPPMPAAAAPAAAPPVAAPVAAPAAAAPMAATTNVPLYAQPGYDPTSQAAVNQYLAPPVAGQPAVVAGPMMPIPQTAPAPGTTKPVVIARPPVEEKPLTETQGKATGFASRMINASKVIDPLDPTAASKAGFGETTIGQKLGPYAGYLESPERQSYKQAQRDWVTANLRQESGAAIGGEEMNNEIIKYFPQPSDDPRVVDQKRRSRESAMQSMIVNAGPGAKKAGLEFKPYEPAMVDRIKSMSAADLYMLDTTKLSEREKAELLARMSQINRGR
jgi:hypothetical protein